MKRTGISTGRRPRRSSRSRRARSCGPRDTAGSRPCACKARSRWSFGRREASIAATALRNQRVTASAGATDFGAYFSYFSFFLMVAALLLAALFFRLSIEQRASQIGVLRAGGFPVTRSPARVHP